MSLPPFLLTPFLRLRFSSLILHPSAEKSEWRDKHRSLKRQLRSDIFLAMPLVATKGCQVNESNGITMCSAAVCGSPLSGYHWQVKRLMSGARLKTLQSLW